MTCDRGRYSLVLDAPFMHPCIFLYCQENGHAASTVMGMFRATNVPPSEHEVVIHSAHEAIVFGRPRRKPLQCLDQIWEVAGLTEH